MDISTIPKPFWYLISISVVILTCGFVYIGIVSGALSIKYKDIEISSLQQKKDKEITSLQLNDEAEKLKKQNKVVVNQVRINDEERRALSELLELLSKDVVDGSPEKDQIAYATKQLQIQEGKATDQLQLIQQQQQSIEELQIRLRENVAVPDAGNSTILINNSSAKEGYLLRIENDLKLHVVNVSDNSVRVRISQGSNKKLSEETLSVGDGFGFEDSSGSKFQVNLLRIGSAGYNRSKKAGYFSVEKM